MDTLWLMCGIAVVAVGLIMMIGGSKGRSLDDVYARRAEAKAQAPTQAQAPAEAPAEATTVVTATPAAPAGRHRVVT